MDFGLTDDQRDIKRTARELLGERSRPERVRELAEAGSSDEALWRELSQLGWPGIAVSAELWRVSGDDVPRHTRILHRDEERHARRDAVAEVALRPGIREAGPLDRRDRRDVSETGGSDQEASVRGAPPTLPEPPRAAHTPARR